MSDERRQFLDGLLTPAELVLRNSRVQAFLQKEAERDWTREEFDQNEARLWHAELFNDGTKWKYSVKVLMNRPSHYPDYLEYINAAMANTHPSARGVTMERVPEGWKLVFFHSPWGFPIMVVG